MRKAGWSWLVLLVCGTLIVGALAILTQTLLAMEEEQASSEARADQEERVRLALTQMDGVAYGLLIAENQRAEDHFQSVSPAGQISPLVSGGGEFVRLYFEIDQQGRMRSPQVPGPDQRLRVMASGISKPTLDAASEQFENLKELLTQNYDGKPGFSLICADVAELNDWNALLQVQKQAWDATPKQRNDLSYQNNYSNMARSKRGEILEDNVLKAVGNRVPDPVFDSEEKVGLLSPVWLHDELFLVREVLVGAETRRQAIWLRQQELKSSLLAGVAEWLPEAELVAVPSVEKLAPTSLVSLPWKLEITESALVVLPRWTPLRVSLLIGWFAVVVALLAAAGLMRGVMRLSERRADFVSAVTHELRTPLTTFRLYSDMMVEGMVPKREKQAAYLVTMRDEAERLQHLVENVLAYSRLERGGPGVRKEQTTLRALIDRCEGRLRGRAQQEGADLIVEIAEPDFALETDINGIEQILFNLVDNACKYGLPDEGKREVKVVAAVERGQAKIRVCDQGAGIRFSERRRLFRPFHKSALDAASSKPGVGLGLSLCRRLARTLGGDLRVERARQGACFLLQLG